MNNSTKEFTSIFEIAMMFENKMDIKIDNLNYYFDETLSVGNIKYPIYIYFDTNDKKGDDGYKLDICKIVETLSCIPTYINNTLLKNGYYFVNKSDIIRETKMVDRLQTYRDTYEKYMNELPYEVDSNLMKELNEILTEYKTQIPSKTIVIQDDNYLKHLVKYDNVIKLGINKKMKTIGVYIVYKRKTTFPQHEQLAIINECTKCKNNFIDNYFEDVKSCC